MGNRLFMLNQPGIEYPAEDVRGMLYSLTSGGTGVSGSRDLKVMAQPAPNGTVQVLPGGAVIRSPYTAASESYQASNRANLTIAVPPTGSGGGRTDLVVLRGVDPQHQDHPLDPGVIEAEAAAALDFWWVEVLTGKTSTAGVTGPVVELARITRPANTAVVSPAHITDRRRLARPQRDLIPRWYQLFERDEQSVHTASVVWPSVGTLTARVPEWATHVNISADWATVKATPGVTTGRVQVRIREVGGSGVLLTQASIWTTPDSDRASRFNIALGDDLLVPASMRGKDVVVEMLGTKTGGTNAYMDGSSSARLTVEFRQGLE